MPLVTTGTPVCSTKRSAASSAPSAQTSVPSTSTGRDACASSAPTVRRASGSASSRAFGRCHRAGGVGLVEELVHRYVEEGRPAVRGAGQRERLVDGAGDLGHLVHRPRGLGDRGEDRRVVELLEAALPQRLAGARPPTTTRGEPLNCAWVTALTPLVTPGPAVSTASPGTRVSLPTASAANTAVCSCRTSRIRIGGSALTAPSYIGKTWAPDSVNIVRTPCAAATATACSPPWGASGPASAVGSDEGDCVTSLIAVRLPGGRRGARLSLQHVLDARGRPRRRGSRPARSGRRRCRP